MYVIIYVFYRVIGSGHILSCDFMLCIQNSSSWNVSSTKILVWHLSISLITLNRSVPWLWGLLWKILDFTIFKSKNIINWKFHLFFINKLCLVKYIQTKYLTVINIKKKYLLHSFWRIFIWNYNLLSWVSRKNVGLSMPPL